ncbi:MAG: DNA/RNA nuclease SfsA [Symbiobacteriaceae bacterium]|nr:DNA/RNA nuclease SfsA [Symbiobacteriaceae bacterium]
MVYAQICQGIFGKRLNRFVAEVEIEGKRELCHVKNTGRCREILVPGALVYLDEVPKASRSTRFDLIAVRKGAELINIDSQAPNRVFAEYLASGAYLEGITVLRPEAKYEKLRFDFYIEVAQRKIFLEVKGVTLETNGTALFPDAPTLRGARHLRELATCPGKGYEAHIVFVIQMKGVSSFQPHVEMDPDFAAALAQAVNAGVKVAAFDCLVTPQSLSIDQPLPWDISRG